MRDGTAPIDRRAAMGVTAGILAAVPAQAAPSGRARAEEYWVRKGAVSLYVYRKVVPPAAGKPVLFLVHGSSFSGRGGFDLQVPGHPGYSVMDWLAARGFDVWTMDHENYGRSSKTEAFTGIDSGVADLAAAFPLVERVTGRRALMVYGQSSGALRAGVLAMQAPQRVDRLVLDAFSYTGAHAPEIQRRQREVDAYRASRFRPMSRAAIQAIFDRDDPSLFEPAVARALADHETALTDRIPNGTYIDMATRLPLVDPARVACPVLITRAQADANATDDEILDFFSRLPSHDRQLAMLGGLAHAGLIGTGRMKLWQTLDAFFRLPLDART